jgi:GT2 family glycosyltransferase
MIYTIIIPTYRRRDDLFRCLDCLAHYFYPEDQNSNMDLEVIVTDDARQLELEEEINDTYSWVKYVSGPGRGSAANRNNGARHARGEWLIFVDDDCLPTQSWLGAFAEATGCAFVLEGKTIAERPKSRMNEESPINEIGGYLWSCNFAIQRSHFELLGGFDEGFPCPAMEDVDLKVRLDALGLEIAFVPKAIVVHPWRAARPETFFSLHQQSTFRFWKKHPHLEPSSYCKHYLYMAIRSFFKVTLPEFLKYRGKGIRWAIRRDAWLLSQAWRFWSSKHAD